MNLFGSDEIPLGNGIRHIVTSGGYWQFSVSSCLKPPVRTKRSNPFPKGIYLLSFPLTFSITIAKSITKAAIHCTGEYFVPFTK